MWDQFRGHQNQIAMFRRAIRRNRTAHAYLFVGPPGIGKKVFARNMAQALFCQKFSDDEFDACGTCGSCRQIQAGTHPDLLSIGCPEGKRELPIELLVGAGESRGRSGLCHELSLRPMSATRRIAIIDDAESMNEASANSLLKTLEEPPPGAIMILLAPETDQILSTIRSRCQIVRFAPLSDEDVEELLVEMGDVESRDQAEKLSHFADGSLVTARQLLNPGLFQLKATVEKILSATVLDSLAGVKAINAIFDELGGDTARQREHMRWMNQFCIDFLSRQLKLDHEPYEMDRISIMLERCFEAELHLRQTMPVALCLESLLDDLSRISRTPIPL